MKARLYFVIFILFYILLSCSFFLFVFLFLSFYKLYAYGGEGVSKGKTKQNKIV